VNDQQTDAELNKRVAEIADPHTRELVEEVVLIMRYQRFDLEATRRERDALQKALQEREE